MAKFDGGDHDVALGALPAHEREIAERFIRAWKAAAEVSSRPNPDSFASQATPEQQAALRSALQRIVHSFLHASARTQCDQAESTQVLNRADSNEPTRSDSKSSDNMREPLATITLDLRPATEVAPDVTTEIPSCNSTEGVDGTIDLSSSTANSSDEDHQFSWDPSGHEEAAKVRGEWPNVTGYQILGELGRGGMGVVYRARQRGLKRLVALKMILSGGHAGQEQLERFRAEAEAVAHLHHPNIVQIHDVGELDGLPFFSLEFVDGHSLDQMIARQPQAPDRSAEIVEQLARAMDYAHSQGIVHRDLKPANILLTLDGVPKVTDFGLVKRLESDSSQTRTGTIMGTPSFMAPEQARGERNIGPSADTYALGSILYTMLTGRPPFMGPTPVDTVMLVINTEPVPPSRLLPKLPRDLEIICLKCLQKEPAKRYATAEAFAEDLRRFRQGEPILARPVGTMERVWRWCRRNPRVATLAAAVSLLAAALMIGSPTAAVLINEQRKAAVDAQAESEVSEKAARKAQGEAEIARGHAVDAQRIADENARIAGTQRQLALDTLSQVVTQVEEKLRDRAELNDLRQNVLKLAMDGLENVSRTSDIASFADRTIGAAHQRMGDILLRAGKANDAREQYRKGLAIFEKLLDSPESDLVRWNAALTHDGLGDVGRKQLDDEKIARGHYERALAYRVELETTATSPKLKPFMIRASLANSYGRISVLLLELACDPEKASEYSEKAIQQSEILLKDLPDHPVSKQALAGAWNLHAETLMRIDRVADALDLASRAMAVREELRVASPESVKARQDVAVSNWTLGEIALASGDPAKALELNLAAHTIRLDLYQNDPDNPEMREDLGSSYYRLGISQLPMNKIAEAAESFESSRELREQVLAADPESGSKQLQFLQAQARCGGYQSTLSQADALRATLHPSPGTLLKLAGIYSTCANNAPPPSEGGTDRSAETCRTIALELLQQAIEGGYRDRFTLAAHPDLSTVRSHPSFAQLLR